MSSDAQGKPSFFSVPVFSWALYDLANTLFAINVTTRHFPDHFVRQLGGADHWVGLGNSAAMALAGLALFFLGTIADHFRKKPSLSAFTLGCIFFTVLIGRAQSPFAAWIAFVLAKFCDHTGLLYYDALLPSVSDSRNRGRVSGLGVALGYLGVPLGLFLADWAIKHSGAAGPFALTAILFGLVAIPCFIWVPDPKPTAMTAGLLKAYKASLGEIWGALRQGQDSGPGLKHLVGACFLFFSVIAATYAYASLYASKVAGFSSKQLLVFLSLAALGAVLGSAVLGIIADRKGQKRSLGLAAWCWGAAMAIAFLLPRTPLFWLVGPLVGAGTGGVLLAGRALVVSLAPKGRTSQMLGLFEMIGNLASIIGPSVWAAVLYLGQSLPSHWGDAWRYRLAILSLLPFFVGGLLFLRGVRESEVNFGKGPST